MRILLATTLPLLLLGLAAGSTADSTAPPLTITGRFVARIDGPPLTGFGENRDLYVFQTNSYPPKLAILSYSFLIYEPSMPRSVLDYSLLYTIAVAADDSCNNSIEDISKAYTFNSFGTFLGTTYAISYSKRAPLSLTLPLHEMLPCYSLSADTVEFLRSQR